MINNKLLKIFLFTLYLASSCTSKKEAYTKISLPDINIADKVDISTKIESINIIPILEESGNRLGSIYKILSTEKYYIIYDRINVNKILLFDKTGKFIKLISKVGESEKDPLNITDCWLNNDGKLEVYDFAQMKIFQYDTSFSLSKMIKSPSFHHFSGLRNIPKTNRYIGYSNFSDYNKPFQKKLFMLAFLDSALNIVSTDREFEKLYQGITWTIFKSHFYVYKDTLRFLKAYDNFIYTIENSKIKERYKIEYSNNPLPDNLNPIIKEHLSDFKNREIDPNIKAGFFKKFSRCIGIWLENDKYIYLASKDTTGNFGTPFYSLIDKSNSKLIYNSRGFIDSSSYNLELPPFEFYDESTSEFISFADGHQLTSKLSPNSVFKKSITDDATKFYIIKTKLK